MLLSYSGHCLHQHSHREDEINLQLRKGGDRVVLVLDEREVVRVHHQGNKADRNAAE